ncbi:hypothetical protein ACNRWW_04255 [Metabacillus sp. HB246100]
MKRFAPLFLVLTIMVIGFFDSPSFFKQEDSITSLPIPEEAVTSTSITEDEQSLELPELETKLVDVKEEDGYTLEVYQVFEVYKDEQGKVIESIPTSQFEYLKYKKS